MNGDLSELERTLSDFDPAKRRRALEELARGLPSGEIPVEPAGHDVNLHCHTFFSYNPYGYSPSQFAWLARRKGLAVAGIVDFDVLDGVDEFIEAGRLLGLRTCAGVESRVFVPEFATRVINSPGEPGIAYHMGVGMPRTAPPAELTPFLDGMRSTAANRNRTLVETVNRHLAPAALDYNRDVIPLTPAGNATERHICEAYARKAREVFGGEQALRAFWMEKLRVDESKLDLPDGPKLQAAIRSATMKKGGVGYVQPGAGSFPTMAEMSRFVLAAGGIPTLTWLDGLSEGEQAIDELMDVAEACGAAALNIIPDRNFTPGVRDHRLENLYEIVGRATRRRWPIVVGTEMNSPGNRFVDQFASPELHPLVLYFLRGARIVYAHSQMQRESGLGLLSDWARRRFPDAASRNNFFETIGVLLEPGREAVLAKLSAAMTPGEVLDAILVDRGCCG